MKGYWRNPRRPRRRCGARADGRLWLHTGDIGYMDEDGYVFLTDRKKDLIKTSGYQVWPREVEEVLIAAIRPSPKPASRASPTRCRGEAVKAWVVLRAGQPATEDELRSYCRERLAPFKVPVAIEFRTELPKSLDRQDSAARAREAARFSCLKAVANDRLLSHCGGGDSAAILFRTVAVENTPASAACCSSHRRNSAVWSVITTFFRPSSVKPGSPREASSRKRS